MRRILLVVPQRRYRVLESRSAMRVGRRADRWITHGGKIEGEKALLGELQIVERRHLHNEIMRMLAVSDRNAECCSSRTNTFAWNMSIQRPFLPISMGDGVEIGSALVPEAV